MSKGDTLEKQWDKLISKLGDKFADGDSMSMDSIIYLIGVQELGKGPQDFSKDDKINLMHIAICRLLESYGYYKFSHKDSDDWPHFELLQPLPSLQTEAQTLLMKEAIIKYFTSIKGF